ncbi:hypothetical protein HSX11_19615 [Oxalobacteraceae bacterium]|nr:hypothetical protein [Oxalobacteraceae bacterium]
MKMTIITDDQGNILAAVQGHSMSGKQGNVEASVTFAPGSQAHMVDVDDSMATITDAADFQQQLKQYLTP